MDLPPPPVQQCISVASPEAARARLLLVVSGDPAQVGAFLAEAARHPVWRVEADATSNEVRFVRLIAPIDVPYREMGGLIFEAQRRQLTVSYLAVPPICELEGY